MKLATKALSHLLLSFWVFANAADTTPSPVFFLGLCLYLPPWKRQYFIFQKRLKMPDHNTQIKLWPLQKTQKSGVLFALALTIKEQEWQCRTEATFQCIQTAIKFNCVKKQKMAQCTNKQIVVLCASCLYYPTCAYASWVKQLVVSLAIILTSLITRK